MQLQVLTKVQITFPKSALILSTAIIASNVNLLVQNFAFFVLLTWNHFENEYENEDENDKFIKLSNLFK